MTRGKIALMTKDPYHTPGYGGFCPQFKYQIGNTFGKTTSNLLQNQDVASSGRLVLGELCPEKEMMKYAEVDREAVFRDRKQSWGDQKLVEKLVPGYTGFIPRCQHYFGNRYAENCKSAIATFEGDYLIHKKKMDDLKEPTGLARDSGKRVRLNLPTPSGSEVSREKPIRSWHKPPLLPIASEPKTYISPNIAQHSMEPSPYHLSNDNPMKSFMSGYTGFVPRARFHLGFGFPITTHKALNEFTDEINKINKTENIPITVQRAAKSYVDNNVLYPVESGVVPHYTGHILGQKFRYGKTFGHSTMNAMSHPKDVCASV